MNSLRARLLVSAGGVLLFFIVLTAVALDRALSSYARQAEYDRLQGLAFSLLGATEVDSVGNVSASIVGIPEPRLQQPESGLAALIYNADGKIVWRSPSLLKPLPSPQLPRVNEWVFSGNRIFTLGYGFEWLLGDNQSQIYALQIQERKSPLQNQRRSFSHKLWWWLGGITAILLMTLLSLMHWGLKPLEKISMDIEKIRAGKKTRLSSKVPTEIQPLTSNLNRLLAYQEGQQKRFRNALGDLAHSLKTPLAVLRGKITQEEARVLDQIDQIIGYQLRRAATSGRRAFQKPTALHPVVERIISALKKVYAEKSPVFLNQIPEASEVAIEEDDLMELIGNILDNAVKHGGNTIKIRASQAPDLRIVIQDDGPGFPEEPGAMLTRGVRADSRIPGQGIGLAVANEIALAYGMRIDLESSSQGAQVTIHHALSSAV
jgi:two-component system sensor histidine kinase PhoQ